MGKKQFKAESKRLLDMMINSIYTHKEIFLRELISNASDAIDKLYYLSLSEKISGINRTDFYIEIKADKEARTLTITDNGIGMSAAELEKNLGTIALSDSNTFKSDEKISEFSENEETKIDIIGQFGVGFYSAFMVADKIEVISKKYGEEAANSWISNGAAGYEVRPSERDTNGTTIIISLRADNNAPGQEETYSEYLEEYHIKGLVKKYSDYIRYPIKMDVTKTKKIENDIKDGKNETADKKDQEKAEPKFETYIETETINSMIPLWKRMKSSITADEYNGFYKDKFMDYSDPLKVIHTGVEGVISYDALMFIPENAPYNYYTKDFEKGLQLYSSGVMIMEKCADLLPDYFSFVRGLVDSQDLSLNISRELLQHDRQLLAIAQRLEKKIQSELLDMQQADREKYEKFFKAFGIQLKFGIYNDFGMKKDLLQDLILYYSCKEKKLITLKEYVENIAENQREIYYATGESIEQIERLPQIELVQEKGFDILLGTDEVDEFCFKVLMEYNEKPIKHISEADIKSETNEEDEKKLSDQKEANKDILTKISETLKDKVKEVRLSDKLLSYPVALASGDGLSIEMEKVMSKLPGAGEGMKADRILEINANHDILAKLNEISDNDESLATYANLMYDMAVVLAGLNIEDPTRLVKDITKLIV
jgi:molecular chaperone HtpG